MDDIHLDVFVCAAGSRVSTCRVLSSKQALEVCADSHGQPVAMVCSVCPAVGVAHWRNLRVQQCSATGSVRQMMLGGASREARVPNIAEGCVPQVGERVMMLKSEATSQWPRKHGAARPACQNRVGVAWPQEQD